MSIWRKTLLVGLLTGASQAQDSWWSRQFQEIPRPLGGGLNLEEVAKPVKKPSEGKKAGRIAFGKELLRIGEEPNSERGGNKFESFLLRLQDGSQLRGLVSGLQGDVVYWKQPGVQEPFPIPRDRVASIDYRAANVKTAVFPDTVKLRNGDWLKGCLVSLGADKAEFLPLGRTAVSIPRRQIEWLYLGDKVGMDCVAGPDSLTGWTGRNNTGEEGWRFRDGALESQSSLGLARDVDYLPDRIRIQLDVLHSTAPNFGLWLFTPKGNSESFFPGTCSLQIHGGGLSVNYHDGSEMKSLQANFNRDRHPPKAAAREGYREAPNIFHYEFFIDRSQRRMIVRMGDKTVANWELSTRKLEKARPENSLSITNNMVESDAVFAISKLVILPWDGVPPPERGAVEKEPGSYRLDETGPKKLGYVESVSDKEVRFVADGKTLIIPRASARFLRLSAPDPGEADVEGTRVALSAGEVNVADAVFHGDVLEGKSQAWGGVHLPLDLVSQFQYTQEDKGEGKPAEAGPRIFFAPEQYLRIAHDDWRVGSADVSMTTAEGKPAALFPWTAVKGVRLTDEQKSPDKTEFPSLLLLRHGGFLPAKLEKLEGGDITALHPSLGEVKWSNQEVGEILLRADDFAEGGMGSADWSRSLDDLRRVTRLNVPKIMLNLLGEKEEERKDERVEDLFIYDGSLLFKPSGQPRNLGRVFEESPERFVMRFTSKVSGSGDMPGTQLSFQFGKRGCNASVYFSGPYANYYEVGAAKEQRARAGQQQNFQIEDFAYPSDNLCRYEVFVDRGKGEITLWLNGAKFGTIRSHNIAIDKTQPELGLTFLGAASNEGPAVYTDVSLRPWDGLLPGAKESGGAAVTLLNGDAIAGEITGFQDGKLTMKTEIGSLTLPAKRVLSYFPVATKGGETQTPKFRFRMVTGGVLPVATFEDGAGAYSVTLVGGRVMSIKKAYVREICPVSP